jgi:hypothetical protein
MFGLTMEDFVPQVEDIISVGEFYEQATGGQIIFTWRCRSSTRFRHETIGKPSPVSRADLSAACARAHPGISGPHHSRCIPSRPAL